MQFMRPFWLLVLSFLWFVSGCGKTPAPPPAPTSGHPLANPLVLTNEPGQPGGRLTLLTPGPPRTFNPLLATDTASDQAVRLLFASLLTLDAPTQEAGPGLAESWSVEPDGRTWTFKLRAGLRWSDGHPLTADDVVFTWNEVMYNPDLNRMTYDLFRVNGTNFAVSKLDEVTVRVVTPEVFAPFLAYFGGTLILPKHIFERPVAERRFLSTYAANTRPDLIVGSGAFRLKPAQGNEGMMFERNPEYWAADRAGRRLPYFDEVRLLPVAGAGPVLLFLNGQGDVCEPTRVPEQETLRASAGKGNFKIVELGPGTDRDFLWFNLNPNRGAAGKPFVAPTKASWFREKTFRQAISCAVDRARLVKEVFGGRAEPVLTYLGRDNPKWNNPDVPTFGYDLARARTLLAGLGIEDRNGDGRLEDGQGNAIEFTLHSNTGNPVRERTAALIAEDLDKLGCKVEVRLVDFAALVEKINATFDYECVLMGLGGGGVDPASQVNVLKSGEPLHQWFPNQPRPATAWEARVDELMDAQMRTLDFGERKKYFDEVQRILAEEQPMIHTVTPFQIAAIRPELGNLRPTALSSYRLTWNIEQLFRRVP